MPTKRSNPSFGRGTPKPLSGVPNDVIRSVYPDDVFARIERDFSIKAARDVAVFRKTVLHAAAVYVELKALSEQMPRVQEERAEIEDIQDLAGELDTKVQLLSDHAYSRLGHADADIMHEAIADDGKKLMMAGAARDLGNGEFEIHSLDDALIMLTMLQYRCHRAKDRLPPAARGRPSHDALLTWGKSIKRFWVDHLGRQITVIPGEANYKTEAHRFSEAIMDSLDSEAMPSIRSLLRKLRSR